MRWKLLGALALIVTAVASVGPYLISSHPSGPSTITRTATASSGVRSVSSTYAAMTVSQTQTTTVISRPMEWITVGQVKPINYYLSLLESNGTEPYVQLAKELWKLPDLKNATAVAKIAYLALNATNPEVEEAFELMMKGGTPDPRDFEYSVPNYNTELQVLYWLALENQFKKDDTLALAIAMVNGLWVTMGDDQVRQAVRKDTRDLLVFFRETNELEKETGYYQLEKYPIEAKVQLVWTGHDAVYQNWPGHTLSGLGRKEASGAIIAKMADYVWDTVSVQTLREMQQFVMKMDWFRDADVGNKAIESYFGVRLHWDNPTDPQNLGGLDEHVPILIDGEKVLPRNFWNVNFIWAYFNKTGRGIGVCAEHSAFNDALNKAAGIPAISDGLSWTKNGEPGGHGFVTYYVPHLRSWKTFDGELHNLGLEGNDTIYLQLFVPPWNQHGYLKWKSIEGVPGYYDSPAWHSPQMTLSEAENLLVGGVPTFQMKQWLFYS